MVKNNTRAGGLWTEARYNSFIKSAVRSMSHRWPVKFEVLRAAQAGRHINKKTGKLAMHYWCAECKEMHPAKDVQVDHIDPIVPIEMIGKLDWNVVIDNALCEADGLQVLCKPCHSVKSKEENAERRAAKKQ